MLHKRGRGTTEIMLRSHEHDHLNAKQNATNERSAAAMLDQSTERELYKLFCAYFSRAEAERNWNLWEAIDWNAESVAPSSALIEATLALYRDVAMLPDYSSVGLSLLRASRGRAWFWTRWSYEESKHQLALQEWLTRRGGWEGSQIQALSEDLLTRYYWAPPCTDACCVLLDALLYELREIEALTALKAQAEAEGEAILAQVASYLIADDEGQRDFLVEAIQIVQRSYPELLRQALQTVASAHEAPELAQQLEAYLSA